MCGTHPGRVCAFFPVADPEEGPGGPASPLFFDQNKARRAEKNFFGDRAPHLSQCLDDRRPRPPPPPPYLSVTVSYDREGFPTKTAQLLGRL